MVFFEVSPVDVTDWLLLDFEVQQLEMMEWMDCLLNQWYYVDWYLGSAAHI